MKERLQTVLLVATLLLFLSQLGSWPEDLQPWLAATLVITYGIVVTGRGVREMLLAGTPIRLAALALFVCFPCCYPLIRVQPVSGALFIWIGLLINVVLALAPPYYLWAILEEEESVDAELPEEVLTALLDEDEELSRQEVNYNGELWEPDEFAISYRDKEQEEQLVDPYGAMVLHKIFLVPSDWPDFQTINQEVFLRTEPSIKRVG